MIFSYFCRKFICSVGCFNGLVVDTQQGQETMADTDVANFLLPRSLLTDLVLHLLCLVKTSNSAFLDVVAATAGRQDVMLT